MRKTGVVFVTLAAGLSIGLAAATTAWGNGGPFIVKSPTGDPAAKGVLARLDPSLRPGRETRLRVVEEDLTVSFGRGQFRLHGNQPEPPLAQVTAAYTIANPTDKETTVDFGFPILRGIYINPLSMIAAPDVRVTVDGVSLKASVISNSIIYGIIRQRARQVIENAVAADARLSALVAAVGAGEAGVSGQQMQQAAQPPAAEPEAAREALRSYLTKTLRWNDRDAALMVEYAGLELDEMKTYPLDAPVLWGTVLGPDGKEMAKLRMANLGLLSAIGEQKATQFFAQLASRFDPKSAAAYEAIFEAWGGDVRQRSVDLDSGTIRPREYSVDPAASEGGRPNLLSLRSDPTIYARVDYLDENTQLTDAEKAACRRVLKNLPVVFTFAPMNLLHYQVTFPAQSERVVSVAYKQYAFTDTRGEGSYQLAYVLHPATLWDDFGPIHLKIDVPENVPCAASVPIARQARAVQQQSPVHAKASFPAVSGIGVSGLTELLGETQATYRATLTTTAQKTGELLIGIDKKAWDELQKPEAQ